MSQTFAIACITCRVELSIGKGGSLMEVLWGGEKEHQMLFNFLNSHRGFQHNLIFEDWDSNYDFFEEYEDYEERYDQGKAMEKQWKETEEVMKENKEFNKTVKGWKE